MNAKRYFYEKMKEMVNSVSGPMTKSSLQTTGKLTPQEFVDAGDALVQKFPAWEWMAGPENVQEYLPKDKKFLMLRKCPCRERASSMMATTGADADEGDGWVATDKEWKPKKAEAAQAMEMEEEKPEGEAEFQWDEEEDDGAAPKEEAPKPAAKADDQKKEEPMRIYDVTVMYDQYYATPRVYLFGYAEGSIPLSKAEMMEDVYAENREKTVTVDPHPYLMQSCISIHPCRHAETMQRLIGRLEERWNDAQDEEGVEEAQRLPFVFPTYMALFPFLKFIASVVPTIQYDISIDIDM